MRIFGSIVIIIGIISFANGMPTEENGSQSDDGFGMLDDNPLQYLAQIPGLDFDPQKLSMLDNEKMAVLKNLLSSLTDGKSSRPSPIPLARHNQIEEIDPCPLFEGVGNTKYYCQDMPDGDYYDPWDPYCGFIVCKGGLAEQMVCSDGTWMGVQNMIGMGQRDLCQRPLTDKIETDSTNASKFFCSLKSDMDPCGNARRAINSKKNPPQK